MYSDFMKAFKSQLNNLISSGSIAEVDISGGPCGELRYPGY
jgi:hypothetical protein